ncbi:hypothetical protein Pfo_012940 [Paulownia fortunei]|nr:hypothetical protein Pfo_012940 [Paulownia fortunei]
MVKKCLKSSLKLLNSSMGLGGIAIIIYGVLMIRVWQPDEEGSSSDQFTIPWFFHAFLGVGIALCAITCLGHIAAQTANTYCLSCYIIIVLLLLVLETVIMADLFLDPNWGKGFCVLLATILRTHEANEVDSYESEDENGQPRLPLLGPSALRQPSDPNIV